MIFGTDVCSHGSQVPQPKRVQKTGTGMTGPASKRDEARIFLVGARGFEPPTPWTPFKCATRLRYAPTQNQSANILILPCQDDIRTLVRAEERVLLLSRIGWNLEILSGSLHRPALLILISSTVGLVCWSLTVLRSDFRGRFSTRTDISLDRTHSAQLK